MERRENDSRIVRLESWREDATTDIQELRQAVYGDGNGTPPLRELCRATDRKIDNMIADVKERRKEMRGIMISLFLILAGQIAAVAVAWMK